MADFVVMTYRIGGFANMISVRNYMAEIAIGFSLPRNKDNNVKMFQEMYALFYIWFIT